MFLDFPRRRCLVRALKRYRSHRGRARDDMAAGCPEKFDRAFFWWLMRDGRTPAIREGYRAVIDAYGDKTVVARTPRDVDALLERLTEEAR